MRNISFRVIVGVFTFLIGIAIPVYWWLFPNVPEVSAPETLIGCNFEITADCQVSKADKEFWENKILSRFNEKTLNNYSESFDESYRLVLLPTFDSPILVRIWKTGDEYFVITKKLSGQGGFGLEKFGKLSYGKTRKLSEQEWFTAIKLIDKTSFWRMSPRIQVPLSTDGASWILEGFQNNSSHEVLRIYLEDDFQKLCLYFMKLSEFEDEYKGY